MNHHMDQRTNSDHASMACLAAARLKLGAPFPNLQNSIHWKTYYSDIVLQLDAENPFHVWL